MMRVLIYGFRPYKHYKQNVTEQILRRLPKRKNLRKVVFPVRFWKRQFLEAVEKHKPDVILGLGQCAKGRRLRIETRAINRRRNDRNKRGRPIVPRGSPCLFTNLKIKPSRGARISRDAGEYVCNYSMYVILDYVRRRRLSTRFGFLHVPHRYRTDRGRLFLLKLAQDIHSVGLGGS
ncbi:MAG: hypothetical protein ACREP8_07720 [Candidatus Binatia bacterium]